MELDKKGFDNLANKEQGEQTKEEDGIHDQENSPEKTKGIEDPPSCQHHDQRERLGKENEPEKNQEKDGITDGAALPQCIKIQHASTFNCLLLSQFKEQITAYFSHLTIMIVAYVYKSVPSKHINQSEWNLLYKLQRVSGLSHLLYVSCLHCRCVSSLPRKHNLFNTIHKHILSCYASINPVPSLVSLLFILIWFLSLYTVI